MLGDGRSLLQALRARELGHALYPAALRCRYRYGARTAELWETILGIEGLGAEDDYFALGGTSLMAARLFAEISRRFGVKMPLTAILELPTVRALSRHLERAQTSPGASPND